MKKLTSILLLATMLLATVALSACGHKCSPADAWTTDGVAHWHKCTDESCTEIFDKANHVWNDGKITKTATQEMDGVKTFTCSVCSGTKTEPIPFTGMTKEEWNAVFDAKQFENFTYTETSILKTTGMEMETVSLYEIEKSKAKVTVTVAGKTESQSVGAADTSLLRTNLLTSLEPMTKFADYKYDAASKTYVLTGEFTIAALGAKADTCTLTFEGGKLVKMVYTCVMVESGISFDVTSTVLFTDYGTTVVK